MKLVQKRKIKSLTTENIMKILALAIIEFSQIRCYYIINISRKSEIRAI